MKQWIILSFFSIIMFSCAKDNQAVNSTNKDEDENPAELAFLALGDSYTIGESVPVPERWPVQLGDSLLLNGFDTVDVEIIARTGWTTGELLDGIANQDPQGPYGLVSLLIGVNNQFRGSEFSVYQSEFKQLLNKAIEFAGNDTSRVIVLSIPDYGVTPFGQRYNPQQIARELDIYNQYARETAEEYGIIFFDITPISRSAEFDQTLIADDDLHPSGKMYTLWVSFVLPQVINLLSSG